MTDVAQVANAGHRASRERAGQGKDLSLKGSYITGNALVSFIGESLSLQLFVPGEPEPLTVDRATVKWIEGSNFGVDFALNPQLTESMNTVISRLVTAHHGASRKGPYRL